MFWIKVLFGLGIGVTFYSYIGYGIVLWFCVKLRNRLKRLASLTDKVAFTPPVTLIVAAYNEADFIEQKIQGGLQHHKSPLIIIFFQFRLMNLYYSCPTHD